MTVRVGADVGGVMTDQHRNDGTDTSFRSDNFLKTTPVDDAFESMRSLVQRYGAENVFIISKCGERIENKTRWWLAHHNLYTRYGFSPYNLYFCRERADKAPIAKELGLTHFVDDRRDVLAYMETEVAHRLLFGPQETPLPAVLPSGLIVVNTWVQALKEIERTSA
jgi:hypothetical protein